MLRDLLIKRANNILEKRSFQPMPGGQPPVDPNAQPPQGDPSMMGGGGAPGGMPMDPSMMGGQGGMPMDPSMLQGGMGGQGGMPMDPSMMGGMGMMSPAGPPPATIGQLSITDFQTMMSDMLSIVIQQIMSGAGAPGAAPAGAIPPPEEAPLEDGKPVSNTEINEKLDALLALISGAAGAGASAGAPGMPPPMAGPEMGFGGQAMGEPPAATGMAGPPPAAIGQPGLEAQASVQPVVKRINKVADMILSKTAKARR